MSNILLKQAKKDIIDWQIKVFSYLPETLRPAIKHKTKTSYQYDFIYGDHNFISQDLKIIYNLCQSYIWCFPSLYTDEGKKQQVYDYIMYCYDKMYIKHNINLWNKIKPINLHFTEIIHGDLTLENIIKTNEGNFVFIDPSPPRYLCCKELDESKLLQSILTGWEVIKRNQKFKLITPPFKIRPVHIALLLTHWIRLYAHKDLHNEKVIKAAEQTINILIKFYQEIKENGNNYIGYRWCLNRLKELGVPGLL